MLSLLPDCAPGLRERLAVVTLTAQDTLEVELLGVEGVELSGFEFFWLEARQPAEYDFWDNQVQGGVATYPVLIQKGLTWHPEALMKRLKKIKFLPQDTEFVELQSPLDPAEAENEF